MRLRGEASEDFVNAPAPRLRVRTLRRMRWWTRDERAHGLALAPATGDGSSSPATSPRSPNATSLSLRGRTAGAARRRRGGAGAHRPLCRPARAPWRLALALRRTEHGGASGDFYDALARGQPVNEAMRSAKLAAIRRGAPASEWAAFSVVGDPSVLVALRPARRWPPPLATLLLSLGALAAVAAVAARHRRTR